MDEGLRCGRAWSAAAAVLRGGPLNERASCLHGDLCVGDQIFNKPLLLAQLAREHAQTPPAHHSDGREIRWALAPLLEEGLIKLYSVDSVPGSEASLVADIGAGSMATSAGIAGSRRIARASVGCVRCSLLSFVQGGKARTRVQEIFWVDNH